MRPLRQVRIQPALRFICSPLPSAISAAILVLVKELENACEPAFNSMSRVAWATINSVSGPSSFMDDLVKGIEQVTETMKPSIEQKKYLRNFFDKAATYDTFWLSPRV